MKNDLHRTQRKKHRRIAIVVIVLVGLAILLFLTQLERPTPPISQAALVPIVKKTKSDTPLDSSLGKLPEVRGVYLPAVVAANPKKLQEIIENSQRLGFNALVIDIKDNHGTVAYDTKVPLAQKIGARVNLLKLDKLLPQLKKLGFYVIARQVVFYDPKLAQYIGALTPHPLVPSPSEGRGERGVRGSVPAGQGEGLVWVSPADARAQEYNLAIAEEAASLGFDELQFDYIRWPDGGAYAPIYAERYDAIERFLQRISERLHGKIRLSADVFGRTLWAWNLKRIDPIGQYL
ncbi:MAG: putative glycoside hydrolase, partial [Candidatus Bipolaricaulia bacterium]